MFLKTLTLKGFKSFADTTDLHMEPGVTVVVGPNGSGKSNVVDAIAWVLGAQAPSAVRSQKMDDVIFAGTSKRSALGRAEVSLLIDNSAGILPIDFSEVTITRTLFRTGDSEYSINGVACRLLDVQELLSDSGVGRQQHVIVSQGQIDAVLNARPEDRRLIVEEAAGVLKFRRRKEKAERRLDSTEANVLRLQDLLREVRRQLRPLEKQADAAQKHGAVIEELKAVRTYATGREIVGLRNRIEVAALQALELGKRDASIKQRLAHFDTQVLTAQAHLSASGVSDLGQRVSVLESKRERARGLNNLVAERRRSAERDRAATLGTDVVASLEAETITLAATLAEIERDAGALGPRVDDVARQEGVLASDRSGFEQAWAELGSPQSVTADASGKAAVIRGELQAVRKVVSDATNHRLVVTQRATALERKVADSAELAAARQAELDVATAAEGPIVAELTTAERNLADAESVFATAESTARGAEVDFGLWTARAQALSTALDNARSRAGAEKLAAIDGVVGTLLDLVDVDSGWEAAFEAAAGEALSAVIVGDIDVARQALNALHLDDKARGAVLALGAPVTLRQTPPVGSPVRAHVRSRRPGVDQLLDAILAEAVVVDGGWQAALDVAIAHPGAVVVTRDGDRFGANGWRVGVAESGATGALLEEATTNATAASALVVTAKAAFGNASDMRAGARAAHEAVTKQLADNSARSMAAANALQTAEAQRREASTEHEAIAGQLEELDDRLRRNSERTAELEAMLPSLELAEMEAKDRATAMDAARASLDQRAMAVQVLRRDLEVRAAQLEQGRDISRKRLAEVESRLARNVVEREQATGRRALLDQRLAMFGWLGTYVNGSIAVIDGELVGLREQRQLQGEATRAAGLALDDLRKQRQVAERELEELRELMRRNELEQAELGLRLEQAVEHCRTELDMEPEAAMAVPTPELAEGVSPIARQRELERELRLMGPINPLALQEFAELQTRHQFLETQLEDVRTSRRELSRVIKAIDDEIQNVFGLAYADVATNFEKLFETLFPGGRGRLTLTNPDDLLNTGIEVEAKPSGKNVKKLSLLSGGERSLTALAFLFAVFRSRPSPFYVMDEVEAALDDVNLHRFLDLIHEFRDEAQLIIVSHQKRTMEAADVLYGVTMQPGGSSRVVSEKINA